MPTYVILTNYTREGMQAVKDAPTRMEAAAPLFNKLGITVKAHYWTMGQYDGLTIIEAPDEATASRFSIAVGASGNGLTETMRAFPIEEFKEILEALP